MKRLITRNIERINNTTLKKMMELNKNADIVIPNNPCLIINYNLKDDDEKYIRKMLSQLWPQIAINIEFCNVGSIDNLDEITNHINVIRSNTNFVDFHPIYVCILFDATNGCLDNLIRKLKNVFIDKYVYNFIVFSFFDMKELSNDHNNTMLECILKDEYFKYKFVFQNKFKNGSLWIGDDYKKILRLAANVIALFTNKIQLFSTNNGIHTFSYGILNKPVRKIVQISIKQLITNLSIYENNNNFIEKNDKLVRASIKKLCENMVHKFNFKASDFLYLPNNEELNNIQSNITISDFKRNYELAFYCYQQMIEDRINEMENDEILKVGVSRLKFEEILKHLNYNNLMAYLKKENEIEELILASRETLVTKKIGNESNFYNVLTCHANNQIEIQITKILFNQLLKLLKEKESQVKKIDEIINGIQNDSSLIVSYPIDDLNDNLISYYENLVNVYYDSNKSYIIKEIDKSADETTFYENLDTVLTKLFNDNDIYSYTFENEINKRKAGNAAIDLYEQISNQQSIENNICLYLDSSQLEYRISEGRGSTILLLRPDTSWIPNTEGIIEYHLNNQDCIERIEIKDIVR